MKSLRRSIERRLLDYRCRYLAFRQPAGMAVTPGRLVVTTFYDVEGDYAVPGKTRPCFSALHRIAEVENATGIRSTYNVVARFAAEAPGLFRELQDEGHEIASHSHDHRVLTTLDRRARLDSIHRARDLLHDLGLDVVGHRSPQSCWNFAIVRELRAAGYRWNAENDRHGIPYLVAGRSGADGGLWRFPVAMDDWWYEGSGMAPGQVLANWQARIETAQRSGGYLAVGFHPWVEDAGDRFAVFREFMHWLADRPGLELRPFRAVMATLGNGV